MPGASLRILYNKNTRLNKAGIFINAEEV